METKEADKDIKGIYNFSPYIYYRNEQLMKDCCLIPYMFHKLFGYRAVIITAKKEEYTYLDLLKGLELDILPTPEDQDRWEDICCNYITQNYEKINILFCFGAYTSHSRMVSSYKQLRPDGKVILKLDANIYWEDRINYRAPQYQFLFDNCNVITVESKRLKKYLSQKWPYRIDYLPNGSAEFTPRAITEYAVKENIILTVGRIGTEQKANEILLEAFRLAADSLPEWKVRLVGNIEKDFLPYKDRFFAENPGLKERITFTGKITDKEVLESEYKKAKIFILTSRREGGTPNVWTEAARNGCYVICSEIDAVDEATDRGRCGRSFEIDNTMQLADLLLQVCKDESCLKNGCYDIQEYQDRFFNYEKIVRKLEYLVNMQTGEM